MPEQIKANDTFWQRREHYDRQPKLMEVLEVEEIIGTRDICQVRWHSLGKDSVSTSVFPMTTITKGHFADFVTIPRELFLKAMDIMNATSIDYQRRKQMILNLMEDYHYTDDEPWALHNKSKAMGTNVYMGRIPTSKQKEELKRLLKKQYEEAIESIDRDEDLRPALL